MKIIIALTIITILGIGFHLLIIQKNLDKDTFVRGKNGKSCYPRGLEPKSIRYRVIFPSKTDCEMSLSGI